MPMEHWTLYGRTVGRLVEAGELPLKVKEDFKAANRDVLSRILAGFSCVLMRNLKPGTPLQAGGHSSTEV